MPAHAAETDILRGTSVAERALSPDAAPTLEAGYAVLVDNEATVWFDRRATEPAQIASLTKIMTALVSVDYLSADTTITVTPTAARVGESSAGLMAGDTMAFEASLKALLTASGNDAATAIAEAAGAEILASQGQAGDVSVCYSAFIAAMNTKASQLGLVNSLFTNPHGLDFDQYAQGQYSCAQDMAFVLKAAMLHDIIRATIGHSQTGIEVVRNGYSTTVSLTNTDTLLQAYPGACAAKTGYTQAAGPCVASAVNRDDGKEYYAIVLGSTSKAQRFIDAAALFDWVFANRDTLKPYVKEVVVPAIAAPAPKATINYQLISSNEVISSAAQGTPQQHPVVAYVAHPEWIDKRIPATVSEYDKTLSLLKADGKLTQEASFNTIRGDVEGDDVVGTLTFRQGDKVVWETDLIAAEGMKGPGFFESLLIGAQRAWGLLSGKEVIAVSELVNTGAAESLVLPCCT